MSTKLPIQKNIEPILKIVSDLEKPDETNPKNKQNLKSYSGNFRSRSLEQKNYNRKEDKRNIKNLLQTKDEQIEKLIEKLSSLYNYNNQFAVENDKLQSEVLSLRESFDELKSKSCGNCALLKDTNKIYEEDREKYTKTNQDLNNDIKMMKTLVFRLNVQLEKHQELLRKNRGLENVCTIDFENASTKDDINWGSVNSHTLGPLLNAYQETIYEKNDLIQQYENEFVHFTGRLKETLEENDKICVSSLIVKTVLPKLTFLFHRLKWMSLRKIMKTGMQLKQGCKLKSIFAGKFLLFLSKIKLIFLFNRNKAEVQTKRADIAKEKLIEVLRCYEQKVQSQSLDLERIQEAYNRTKSELNSVRNLNKQPEVVVESLKECQKLFEELKAQHDIEKKKMKEEIIDLTRKLTESEESSIKIKEELKKINSIVEKQKECNEILNEKNHTLRQNLHHIRSSREQLKSRLKKSRNQEGEPSNTWTDLNKVQGMIHQRESQIQTLQMRHVSEIEEIKRKLQQRDETLRKVLNDKVDKACRRK